ncbi:hypothetical protein [Microbacterium sp. NPDC079995]|uniref:hypothetical protein n=1 Tax=unclassified Microbacterium TaxID=2609290 RepID=UPI00344F0CB9
MGDSALRAGLLEALRESTVRMHVFLDGQTSDYVAGLPLNTSARFYSSRRLWLAEAMKVERPVYLVNAGEINPRRDLPFPHPARAAELHRVLERDGMIIAAGLGLKDPSIANDITFDHALRNAAVMSWRDRGSQEAAGFGGSAPDWAFSLGPDPRDWLGTTDRDAIAVTLRFDRPWPDSTWLRGVRAFADSARARVVTLAQVARDAPRAVALAEALGGEYSVPPSMQHDALDRHVRSIYRQSVAVVSDRAHALIMGATEGAYPIGSASDPQKIIRILNIAGVGALTGDHASFQDRAEMLHSVLPTLKEAMDSARAEVHALGSAVRRAISLGEDPVFAAAEADTEGGLATVSGG